jgi:hypothetical protein
MDFCTVIGAVGWCENGERENVKMFPELWMYDMWLGVYVEHRACVNNIISSKTVIFIAFL